MPQSSAKRRVGRPREFDKDEALASVMDVFWEKGYEATSLADLCESTGLHKGSLYQAFGDKHQLFMSALKHYSDAQFDDVSSAISDEKTPLTNLRRMIDKICSEHLGCHGCLVVNTMVELGPHDDAVHAFVDAERSRRESVITRMIAGAREMGEVRQDVEPAAQARRLMVTMAGVNATVKGFLSVDEGRQMLHDLIDSWT